MDFNIGNYGTERRNGNPTRNPCSCDEFFDVQLELASGFHSTCRYSLLPIELRTFVHMNMPYLGASLVFSSAPLKLCC